MSNSTCPKCGKSIRKISTWIGTPPPGWKPGDPAPHVCPPDPIQEQIDALIDAEPELRVAQQGAVKSLMNAVGKRGAR